MTSNSLSDLGTEIAVEVSRMQREALVRAEAKVRALQTGELFNEVVTTLTNHDCTLAMAA